MEHRNKSLEYILNNVRGDAKKNEDRAASFEKMYVSTQNELKLLKKAYEKRGVLIEELKRITTGETHE
jgi:hypothetical protein